MKKRKLYESPAHLREINVYACLGVLSCSIVDNASITSTGQQVDNYDFGGADFNHNWED